MLYPYRESCTISDDFSHLKGKLKLLKVQGDVFSCAMMPHTDSDLG